MNQTPALRRGFFVVARKHSCNLHGQFQGSLQIRRFECTETGRTSFDFLAWHLLKPSRGPSTHLMESVMTLLLDRLISDSGLEMARFFDEEPSELLEDLELEDDPQSRSFAPRRPAAH